MLASLCGLRSALSPSLLVGPSSQLTGQQVRHRSQLFPRRTKYRKAQKGRVPLRTGGSTVGTTVEHGDYGLRVKEGCQLAAKVLTSCEAAIKRGIKPVKGAKCYLRVFPDIPVCIKGNETRMGKGKGTFEYWSCRAPIGTVLFEVGGGDIRPEIAKTALKLAAAKLPVKSEFITRQSLPMAGYVEVAEHFRPGKMGTIARAQLEQTAIPVTQSEVEQLAVSANAA
ncbi:uncharacterized protein L969DRAFT_53099 [Mixia osmundae IAM 14324]|uniref:Uncharacterized protein n=1 Tax=Mixia osmundae (strain CBS 9802 / IAM 14324 / JCM 22182 / KY 12970) TaxID=764103 RepID=G7DWD5_MIXOS|nr:uncharacterized protein L969DRAFT_53099 [Mixia osmundae IAM 14324]KEI37293.1 hypothetical protein L969DRAFT_53099 [Mixia osmundae IAM 14324]GAA94895.1 hypothetical protein E5Q_01550 [Mixia osmundae IAM 14324]